MTDFFFEYDSLSHSLLMLDDSVYGNALLSVAPNSEPVPNSKNKKTITKKPNSSSKQTKLKYKKHF